MRKGEDKELLSKKVGVNKVFMFQEFCKQHDECLILLKYNEYNFIGGIYQIVLPNKSHTVIVVIKDTQKK